jgi:hypothetical protein
MSRYIFDPLNPRVKRGLLAALILLGILGAVGIVLTLCVLYPVEAMVTCLVVAAVGICWFYGLVIYYHLEDRENGRW